MRSNLKLVFNYFLLVFILSSSLDAKKLETLVAINLSPSAEKTISNYQDLLKKSADQSGYNLDTNIVAESGFHITLESAVDVDEKDIKKYIECITSIASQAKPFNITDDFSQAQFKILGWSKNWAVLHFPAPHNGHLAELARKLRSCFRAARLKVGQFQDFKAHVSLGKFIKAANTPLPDENDLNWVPKPQIVLPKDSFIVKNIVFSTRQRITDKQKNKQKIIKGQKIVYELGANGQKQQGFKAAQKIEKQDKPNKQSAEQEKTADEVSKAIKENASIQGGAAPGAALNSLKKHTKKQKNKAAQLQKANNKILKQGAIEQELIIEPMKIQFTNAIRRKKRALSKAEVLDLLAFASKQTMKAHPDYYVEHYGSLNLDPYTLVNDLFNVQEMFNVKLLVQKTTDKPFKLSEQDTLIFNALPDPLKAQLLENRRIEFTGKVELPKALPAQEELNYDDNDQYNNEYEDELNYEDIYECPDDSSTAPASSKRNMKRELNVPSEYAYQKLEEQSNIKTHKNRRHLAKNIESEQD